MEDVAIALGRDHPDDGARVLDHDVRRDRRAVEDLVERGRVGAGLLRQLLHPLDRPLRRVVRRRRQLVHPDHASLVVDVDQVGERAADVDSDALHAPPPAVRTIFPKNSLLSMSVIASAASSSGNVAATCGSSAPRAMRSKHVSPRPIEDERPDHLQLAPEERDDVERHDLTRVRAADDEPAVLRERVEPVLEVLAADVLVDDVDAVAVGDPQHLLDDVLRRVVDPDVEPELGCLLELVVAARGADHERARELRDLDGRGADPAPDRVDEHRLPRTELRAGHEHVPGRAEGDVARGRLDVGDAVGDPDQLRGLALHLLRVAAARAHADEPVGRSAERLAAGSAVDAVPARRDEIGRDPVADLPPLDALAERRDSADRLHAERVRERDRKARDALADVDIEVVERAGA